MFHFELFQNKLEVDMSCEPEIRFGRAVVCNKENQEAGEILIYACSYLISDEVLKETKKEKTNIGNLSTDFQIDNILKVYSYAYLNQYEDVTGENYLFLVQRSPLFKRESKKGYVRNSICVSFPERLQMESKDAVHIGFQFIEQMPMESIDVKNIVEGYNDYVEMNKEHKGEGASLSDVSNRTSETYCFVLPSLSNLYNLPFHSKGTVYQVYGQYVYETDSPLFDFLEEYTDNFSKEHVVIKDVKQLFQPYFIEPPVTEEEEDKNL